MTGKVIAFMVLMTVTGCATLPTGPSVRVLPGDGKPFEEFVKEDAVCKQWAARAIGMTPEETARQSTISGATIGTLLGAGAGAAIGAGTGSAAAGAAIGAGSGLLVGTASGAESGRLYGDEAQRRYDNTYVQCMYAKGNLVPGMRVRYRYQQYTAPPDYAPEQ
ncbi:MAG TPA: glycine zipper family protein [Geomonas sp.]|nr:glycine zipper family protein [Geomonas sp.]